MRALGKLFTLANANIYWVFVGVCLLYFLGGNLNTPEYVPSLIVALIAAGLVLHQVRYRWVSFISIFTIGHVISYVVGPMVVLSLSDSSFAIEPELWKTTPVSVWAMIVGMLGLMLGIYLAQMRHSLHPKPEISTTRESSVTPVWFNVSLCLLIVPVLIVHLRTRVYYHKDVTGIESYDFGNAESLGFLGYFTYMSYGGTILQIRRYLTTRDRSDLNFMLLCVVLPLLAILPSGSRVGTFSIITIAALYFIDNEKSAKLRHLVLASSTIFLVLLTTSIEQYRTSAQEFERANVIDRLGSVARSIISQGTGDGEELADELSRAMLGRRLSDNVSVGYLIQVVPSDAPHRGISDMRNFAFYLLPTFIRPAVDLDFNYDAVLMRDLYGFRANIGGSSPMMIIGELYVRFGWFGIFLGMSVIGFMLTRLDQWVLNGSVRGTLLWSMLFYGVVNMYAYSLLKVFTLVTRQLVIFMVIVGFLEYLLSTVTRRKGTPPLKSAGSCHVSEADS